VHPAKVVSPTRPNQDLASPTHPSFGTISNQAQGYTPAVSNTPGSSRPYNVTGRPTTAHVGTNAAPTLSGGFDSRAGLQNYGQTQGRTSPGSGSSQSQGQGQQASQTGASASQSRRYSGLGPVMGGKASPPIPAQPTVGSENGVGGFNPTRSTSNPNPPAQAGQQSQSYFRSSRDRDRDADRDLDDDEGDGSSIMGRAANIASTAKDLLGALWYGANDGGQPGGASGTGATGAVNGGKKDAASARHKRGQSIG
jgi:hypothetical protein